jgi:hypothetical protein
VKAGVSLERHLLEANRRQYRAKLSVFERRYRMTSKRFVNRFNAGQLDEKDASKRTSIYDTTLLGYSNSGHTFGDALSAEDRKAVIEYVKTL